MNKYKGPIRLSPFQEYILTKMEPTVWYRPRDLGCQKKTLHILGKWGLAERELLSLNWRLSERGIAHRKRLALTKSFNSPSGQEK